MRAYVGNTDRLWYAFLRDRPDLDEVNFWFPSGGQLLRVTGPESATPFLFKLKAERGHAVCGFGYLVEAMSMPAWYAWETFGEKNGAADEMSMYRRIGRYRKAEPLQVRGAEIGCLIVVQPTFFPEDLLVPPPEDWKPNIVRGRYYDTREGVGARLWRDCLDRAALLRGAAAPVAADGPLPLFAGPKFGAEQVVRPRLGQGAFRVGVMKAYDNACAITREHSLPVLDAAHIKPYADDGEHDVANGIALRADLHRLFDKGYVTFDETGHMVVSRRLREDFENGAHYYAMQEERKRLWVPRRQAARPREAALAWHREERFLG